MLGKFLHRIQERIKHWVQRACAGYLAHPCGFISSKTDGKRDRGFDKNTPLMEPAERNE